MIQTEHVLYQLSDEISMEENEFKKVNMNDVAEVLRGHVFQMNQNGGKAQNKKAFDAVQDDFKLNKSQKQSLQSMKMRSLGTFAGTFVHDFNNIFATILASSSLLEMNKVRPEKYAEMLTAMNNAVGRGAELLGQILTFTGSTDVSFNPLAVPDFINNVLSELKKTFPQNIIFQETIEKNLSCINADQAKMQQVMVNLFLNARDAMPEGGTITVQVSIVERKDIQELFSPVDHDQYLCISIADTGVGIEEPEKDLIFDPFFTTKKQRKGLGLSVVYGIVKAHQGFIDLESVPGQGSTFYLYFPAMTSEKKNSTSLKLNIPNVVGGTETILVVEDEKSLLELACIMLSSKGYTVLTAMDGKDAVELYKQHREKISLVFSDIGLPGLNGREVFTKLKEMNQNVKMIFTSGIFIDIKEALLKDGAKDFIQKPYEPKDVLRKIREILDAR
jgi:two-component system cell cycle sensor histidine kinase/response regulator CckA